MFEQSLNTTGHGNGILLAGNRPQLNRSVGQPQGQIPIRASSVILGSRTAVKAVAALASFSPPPRQFLALLVEGLV